METSIIWADLALSDLKSAKILYAEKQYRTSYFLFQQATEKANKAFALRSGLTKEEKLKDVGHDQFKIMRSYLVKKLEEFDKLSEEHKNDPSKFAVKKQSLINSLRSLDKLRNQDLVNISIKDINALYKESLIFQIPYNKRFPQLRQYFNKSKESMNVNHIGLLLLQWSQDFFFIWLAILSCGLLTTQHSSLTRYPENGKNPLRIYNRKLPLIRKQPLFMDLLENAILKMKVQSNKLNNLDKFKLENIKSR